MKRDEAGRGGGARGEGEEEQEKEQEEKEEEEEESVGMTGALQGKQCADHIGEATELNSGRGGLETE
jgi:hypothetical protein